MSETPTSKNTKIITAIKALATDLWGAFGGKNRERPLGLYLRLLTGQGSSSDESIEKFIKGFTDFFNNYELAITEGRMEAIEQGTKITYGGNKNIAIEIQHFLAKSDQDSKESIRKHLLVIGTLISPSEAKRKALDKKFDELGIDVSTKEGEFISDMMKEVKDAIGDEKDVDPTQAMMMMCTSGVLPKLFKGVSGGEFNLESLGSAMEGLIGTMPVEMQRQIHSLSTKMAIASAKGATTPASGSPEVMNYDDDDDDNDLSVD